MAAKHRSRQHREAMELAGMLRRMGKALVRRAAEGDLEALEALTHARAAIDDAIGDAAAALHQPCVWVRGEKVGYSWAEIGGVLGISRQAAHQQFGKRTVSTDTNRG